MELDKKFIENLIREIISEEMSQSSGGDIRQVDPSGVISLDPSEIVLEKFPFPIESDRVWLKDVFSLEESPRLGCGIMEVEDTSLLWTLQYDEIDYVIDGTLDLIIDGRKVSTKAGGIVLIPKGSTVTFSAQGKARFMYVVYPANWSEQ